MFQVSKLSHLKILNLAHNCIVTMEGLKELKLLTWLSLASNSIKGIEQLNQNVRLEHLDLSDNAIPAVTDISYLKNLKVRTTLLRQSESYKQKKQVIGIYSILYPRLLSSGPGPPPKHLIVFCRPPSTRNQLAD